MIQSGFDVGDIWTDFDDQYLMIAGRPAVNGSMYRSASPAVETIDELQRLVSAFSRNWMAKQAQWRKWLRESTATGQKVAVWGSGSKAVSFLTTLSIDDEVRWIVDVNPHRQGKFMPGTGHPIVGPDEVARCHPDVIVVMNPIYHDEIKQSLVDRGCTPTIVTM
jgi:hypothetical protein